MDQTRGFYPEENEDDESTDMTEVYLEYDQVQTCACWEDIDMFETPTEEYEATDIAELDLEYDEGLNCECWEEIDMFETTTQGTGSENINLENAAILKLKETKVIPDIIDTQPEDILVVKYGSVVCKTGEIMKPIQVCFPPELVWEADIDKFYTVCMIDPDAPSRENPKSREWHHWLVVNIPGTKVEAGETLSEYIGAGPPKGTGLHRYVLLVYKQKGKVKFEEMKLKSNSGFGRGKFSIKNFAKKYDLGQPIAANVFMVEWDDYVPKLQRQLSG